LRFLCPNCHSQTPTYSGKNIKRIKANDSKDCVVRSRKFEVSFDDLKKLIDEKPMTEIARMYNVSDSAIRKRCIKLGIDLKPMNGYWSKKKFSPISSVV
jgi:CRISPR/Cas system-associated protein Csm6